MIFNLALLANETEITRVSPTTGVKGVMGTAVELKPKISFPPEPSSVIVTLLRSITAAFVMTAAFKSNAVASKTEPNNRDKRSNNIFYSL
jgi:hypothetical protein